MNSAIYHPGRQGADAYITQVESDNPIIRAAYEVAERAHEGQPRSESTGAPYIVHPVMVYHILKDFGIENPLTLAAGLLHDAIEDCDAYRADPSKMADDLWRELRDKDVEDADPISHYITEELCMPLTNPGQMMEGKRTYQAQHADSLSSRTALLKIVDQLASVLDSIIVEDASIDIDKKRDWNYKALDVVKSAVSDRERLYYWGNLFKVLFSYNMEMLDAQEAGDMDKLAEMRKNFNYEEAKEQAKQMPFKPAGLADESALTVSPSDHNPDQGCLSVQLNSEGKVCGYQSMINPVETQHDARNACAITLVGEIERSQREMRVTTGTTPDVVRGRMVRTQIIKPAMGTDEFCAIARKCGAVADRLEEQVTEDANYLAAASKEGGKTNWRDMLGASMRSPRATTPFH